MLTQPQRSRRPAGLRDWAAPVERCPLFAGLDPDTLGMLVRLARPCDATPGEFFFLEGDPSTHVYLLLCGRVRLVRSGAQGRALIVRFIRPPEPFGYVAAWAGTVHGVAAQAAAACRAIAWDATTLAHLTLEHPSTARVSLRLMAERVERGWDRLQDLTPRRIECRLARALLRLGRPAASPVLPDSPIALDLREQDLAELVGATTFTISRILSAWRRSGLAEVHRAHILVRDPQRLRAIEAARDPLDSVDAAAPPARALS